MRLRVAGGFESVTRGGFQLYSSGFSRSSSRRPTRLARRLYWVYMARNSVSISPMVPSSRMTIGPEVGLTMRAGLVRGRSDHHAVTSSGI